MVKGTHSGPDVRMFAGLIPSAAKLSLMGENVEVTFGCVQYHNDK